ncbi:ArsR family transcriptional regulator [Chromohalobacter japonicus]|uniref:ArsR family transcriptional regulator n=1 Tax=Chromohalobacter japonicus TaxID=223900 RepID=UPI003D7C1EC2
MGLSQPVLSQHLRQLRDSDVVGTQRKSQTIYYRVAEDAAPREREHLSRPCLRATST